MTRGLTFTLVLLTCGVSQAALKTNFAASYGKYQACVPSIGASKCYKLFCDPEGIIELRLTSFIDVPTPGAPRLNGVRELVTHPEYTGAIQDTTVTTPPGRELTESRIFIQALNQISPPIGQILLFTYETGDLQDALGSAGAVGGFRFQQGDYVKLFDTDTQQVITYNFPDPQLQDVMFPFTPEPSSGVLAVGLMTAAAAWRRKLVR